jgi:hypothetical protein
LISAVVIDHQTSVLPLQEKKPGNSSHMAALEAICHQGGAHRYISATSQCICY